MKQHSDINLLTDPTSHRRHLSLEDGVKSQRELLAVPNHAARRKPNSFKIATWNVPGINQTAKLQIIIDIMSNQNISPGTVRDLLGSQYRVSMTSKTGERYTVYLAGHTKRKGVGLIIWKPIDDQVTRVKHNIDEERVIGCPIRFNQ